MYSRLGKGLNALFKDNLDFDENKQEMNKLLKLIR